MNTYFISTVLGGETELDAQSRFFVATGNNLTETLGMLMMAFDQDDSDLKVLRRTAPLDSYEDGDFDAPLDLAPIHEMDLGLGQVVAGEPYHGTLDEALPQTGTYVALLDLRTGENAGQQAMAAVKADNAKTALRIILAEAEKGGADLKSVDGLMDASMYGDADYEFEPPKADLLARVAAGESFVLSTPIAYEL